MSKKITPEDIRHIAHLARLKLTDDEISLFTAQLADILGYVGRLSELDLSAAPPESSRVAPASAPREDKSGIFPGREELLANAPSRSGEYIKVKKVIE